MYGDKEFSDESNRGKIKSTRWKR